MLTLLIEALVLLLLSVGLHLLLWRVRPEWMLHRYPTEVQRRHGKGASPLWCTLSFAALYILYPACALAANSGAPQQFNVLYALLSAFFLLFTVNSGELMLALALLGKKRPAWVILRGDVDASSYNNPLFQVIQYQKGILLCLAGSALSSGIAYAILRLMCFG